MVNLYADNEIIMSVQNENSGKTVEDVFNTLIDRELLSYNDLRAQHGLIAIQRAPSEYINFPKIVPVTKTNCPNCGAPIHGAKCEYCDTEFYILDEKCQSIRSELIQTQMSISQSIQSQMLLDRNLRDTVERLRGDIYES